MKITVETTNNYPFYERQIITVRGEKNAEKRAKEISDEIIHKINKGELQDGFIYVTYK